MLEFKANDRILICPLGWGLGHATRCIPIIKRALGNECHVTVAADQDSIALLRTHFPNLTYIFFPSVRVRLSSSNPLWALARVAAQILTLTLREKRKIKRIVSETKANVIISDNRYGLAVKGIKSVLVTHQLNVMFPSPFRWAQPIGQWYVRAHAEQFTQCWIPDNPQGASLSGLLCQPKEMPKNAVFIGTLSRFEGKALNNTAAHRWDIVAILSGPPPHRANLESIITSIATTQKLKALIIQGLPQGTDIECSQQGWITKHPHLSDNEIMEALSSARHIISRSGYSTVMDFIALNCKAILVPTPGQTEQEYLAAHLAELKLFESVTQDQLFDYFSNAKGMSR